MAAGRLGVTEIVSAVIPCLDEEDAIGAVVSAVLAQGVAEVIVVDGASRDGTAERAAAAGARVVVEARRGYGRAVQAGLAVLRQDASMVVFLDGDGSDPAELIPADGLWRALQRSFAVSRHPPGCVASARHARHHLRLEPGNADAGGRGRLAGRGDSSRPALPDRRRVESVGESYRQHQGRGGSRDHIRSPRAQLTPRATA